MLTISSTFPAIVHDSSGSHKKGTSDQDPQSSFDEIFEEDRQNGEMTGHPDEEFDYSAFPTDRDDGFFETPIHGAETEEHRDIAIAPAASPIDRADTGGETPDLRIVGAGAEANNHQNTSKIDLNAPARVDGDSAEIDAIKTEKQGLFVQISGAEQPGSTRYADRPHTPGAGQSPSLEKPTVSAPVALAQRNTIGQDPAAVAHDRGQASNVPPSVPVEQSGHPNKTDAQMTAQLTAPYRPVVDPPTRQSPQPSVSAVDPPKAYATRPEQKPAPAAAQIQLGRPATKTAGKLIAADSDDPNSRLFESLAPERPEVALRETFGSTPPSIHLQTAPRTDVQRSVAIQVAESLKLRSEGPYEVALNPEELGRVRLAAIPSETGYVMTIMAERPETLELMRRNLDLLAAEMRKLGYGDVGFEFADQGSGARNQTHSPIPKEPAEPHVEPVAGNVPPDTAIQQPAHEGMDLRL